ncbi:MAG: hypothetical protein WBM04_14360, partial [Candidatus Korobacteraceae bacterium]
LISPSKVEHVKFIKGSDGLKSLSNVLQKTNVGIKFPPAAEVRVVRRAVVTCGTTTASPSATTAAGKGKAPVATVGSQDSQGPAAPCTIELLPAESVHTLD